MACKPLCGSGPWPPLPWPWPWAPATKAPPPSRLLSEHTETVPSWVAVLGFLCLENASSTTSHCLSPTSLKHIFKLLSGALADLPIYKLAPFSYFNHLPCLLPHSLIYIRMHLFVHACLPHWNGNSTRAETLCWSLLYLWHLDQMLIMC